MAADHTSIAVRWSQIVGYRPHLRVMEQLIGRVQDRGRETAGGFGVVFREIRVGLFQIVDCRILPP